MSRLIQALLKESKKDNLLRDKTSLLSTMLDDRQWKNSDTKGNYGCRREGS